MSKTLSKTDKATKLAIIFTSGGGSSWCQGSDDNHVLSYKAGKHFKRDWKHLFKLPKGHVYPVNIYDYTEAKGWHCGFDGVVKCNKTNKQLKFVKTVYATV